MQVKRERHNSIRRQAEQIMEVDLKTAKKMSEQNSQIEAKQKQKLSLAGGGDNPRDEADSTYLKNLPIGDPIGERLLSSHHALSGNSQTR